MKMPWKKNFRKIPDDLLTRSTNIESNYQVVSAVKKIELQEILDGVYNHIGMKMENEEIIFDEYFIPSSSTGRYSGYNVNGRSIVRRDLPKITREYSNTVPIYGDWTKGSTTVTRSRLVFQRTFWLPQNIGMKIDVLEKNEQSIVMKFSLDTIIDKNSDNYFEDLLFQCNLLQENIGIYNIFEIDASNDEYIKTLYVNWELLPPGQSNIENNTAVLLSKFNKKTNELNDKIIDRFTFFESLNPEQYIVGENRFSQYFGAKFSNDIVILENVRYGNAIYLLYEKWEELSKLSRTELLNSRERNFIRIIHRGNWKNSVVNYLR